jgi:hypothetical protein
MRPIAQARGVSVAQCACQPLTAGFNVDALVEGNWVTIANFDGQKSAMDRAGTVLTELKGLYRYGN